MIRRESSWVLLLIALLPGCSGTVSRPSPVSVKEEPAIVLRRAQDGTSTFAVVNADLEIASSLSGEQLEQTPVKLEPCPEVFSIRVVSNDKELPPLLGSYRIVNRELLFTPRFPLQPGVRYRAHFEGEPVIEQDFMLPKPQVTATTTVEHVYPTRDLLPENLLKFYIHFSAPMNRGEAYSRIHLLNEAGKQVERPFLELDEELWDRDHQRFTLFFDPGRIKRGLKPREEFGPALEAGKSYTLVIDRDWADAEGNPLKEAFRKHFRVAAPDDQCPDPKNWKIQPPAAGAKEPLLVTLPEPLDHALLERMIWVTNEKGQMIRGNVSTLAEETQWQFTPEQPWPTGGYFLVAQTTLEDLAGNSIGQPFEVDVFHPIRRQVDVKTVQRSFQVR